MKRVVDVNSTGVQCRIVSFITSQGEIIRSLEVRVSVHTEGIREVCR